MTGGGTMVTNLCFHGIGTPPRSVPEAEARYWISTDMFKRVLDIVDAHSDTELSFDDGNITDLTIAVPELTARGMTGAFFILAGRLGVTGSLAVDDVAEVRAAGMRVGSHGMAHQPWRGLSESEQAKEFDEARMLIADAAGASVDEAACPLGSYDRQVIGALRQRGYRRVLTSDRAVARSDRVVQPRFSLRASDDIDVVIGYLRQRYRPLRRVRDEARMLVKRNRW